MEWNPLAPDVLGPEFGPRPAGTLPAYSILGPASAAAMTLESTATQTVDEVGVFVGMDASGGVLMAEVFAAGTEVPGTITTTVLRPVECNAFSNAQDQAGGTSEAQILAVIAGTALDVTKYVQAVTTPTAMQLAGLQFATTGVFTGRRIVDVRLVGMTASVGTPGFQRSFVVVPSGVSPRSYGQDRTVSGSTPVEYSTSWGEVSTKPGETPWTVADLENFASGGTCNFDYLTGDSVDVQTYQVWLEVDHCAENRLSRDIVTPGDTGHRWAFFTPHKPNDAANLTKTNGQDLTLVLRTPRYGTVAPTAFPANYTFVVPYIEGVSDTPPAAVEFPLLALNADGTVAELGDPSGDRVIGFHMALVGSQLADSQQYAAAQAVTVTGTVEQEISDASAQAYDGVIVSARYTPEDGLVSNMTAQLRNRSGGGLLATATITKAIADQFAADTVAGWRRIQVPFDAPPTLAPATQYYLKFAESGKGTWEVAALSGAPVLGYSVQGVGSYGGTGDVATFGGGDVPTADLAAMIYADPDAPTGLTATFGSTPLTEPTDACGPTGIPYITLRWDPTALTHFVAYEIQRYDEFTDWQTIALITDELVDEMVDWHGRLDRLSIYRIRTVSATGSTSPWSTEASATRSAMGCALTFTNNAVPEMGVAYTDIYTGTLVDRIYDFPETEEVLEQPIYGRDDVVAFIPAERRGPKFTRRVLISGDDQTLRPGEGFADQLRDLSRSALPYVCVCDEDGGRWFANVRVTSGTDRRPGRFTYADITVVQVTSVEEPIDVAL